MSDKWWSILTFGSLYDGPHGPWKGREDAEEALGMWRERKGSEALTIENASALRIAGPFDSRDAARNADISDYPA